jgi:hypothetical protein
LLLDQARQELLFSKGINDLIPSGLSYSLFIKKVEAQIQLHWYRNMLTQVSSDLSYPFLNLCQKERSKRVHLEKSFSLISQYTEPRETFVEDLALMSNTFETPSEVLTRMYGELAQKAEVRKCDDSLLLHHRTKMGTRNLQETRL